MREFRQVGLANGVPDDQAKLTQSGVQVTNKLGVEYDGGGYLGSFAPVTESSKSKRAYKGQIKRKSRP